MLLRFTHPAVVAGLISLLSVPTAVLAQATPAQPPAQAAAAAPGQKASGPAANRQATPAKPAAPKAAANSKAAQEKIEVVDFKADDPAMRGAFIQAQRTLEDFLKAASGNKPHLDSIGVRVRLREGERVEYLWVMPVETADGRQFRGVLNDVPRVLRRVTFSQQVSFPRSDIVDWMYYDKQTKVMHGHYTTCVLMKDAPAHEAAEVKKRYGLDCQRNNAKR